MVTVSLAFGPSASLAATTADDNATTNDTVFYAPEDDCTTNATGGASGPSNLPSSVPAPYNAIFSAAAAATHVDPILLATIFYTENRGFPDPPPPYGNGPAWRSSNAGAQGPFQFLPGTWASYGQGGNILDLKDAANGAGRYLVALGGRNGVPLGNPTNPRQVNPSIVLAMASYNAGPAGNFNNPETLQYIQIGVAIYKKLSGDTGNANNTVITPTDTSTGCNADGSTLGSGTPIGTGRNSIVAIAKSQIGTRENPSGCNCGGTIQPDGHTVASYTQNNPEPWCADFVSWVYMKAGVPFSGGRGSWDIPSAAGIVRWMQAHGVWARNGANANPQPGDIIYFDWDGTGVIGPGDNNDHIGIVVSASGNTLYTIQGNAGDRVQAVTYTNWRTNPDIVGFGGLK
jgi:hypothetical protein